MTTERKGYLKWADTVSRGPAAGRNDNVMAQLCIFIATVTLLLLVEGRGMEVETFDGLPADGILMGGLNTILIAQGVRLIKKLIFAGDAIQQNRDN